MPKVTLENCDILQVESRPYKGKDGQPREARTVLARYDGKIFMFAVSREALFGNIQEKEGESCGLVLEMTTFGKELEPNFAVVDVA